LLPIVSTFIPEISNYFLFSIVIGWQELGFWTERKRAQLWIFHWVQCVNIKAIVIREDHVTVFLNA
jgi:hypothetical protein